MITVEKLCKRYGKQCVLSDISFKITKGEICGLVGVSGSGKSTLLRCLQGIEKPDSGNIKCDDDTGFVFQDFQLFPHMTVWQNLVYAPVLHNMDSIDKRAKYLLDKLGIFDQANKYPHKLSGGQRQRVSLARSLMMEPGILLCDEPTSGLDFTSICDVIELLSQINNMGLTMVITSHDLEFLSQISNKILLIKNGNINMSFDSSACDNQAVIEALRTAYSGEKAV